MVDRVLPYVSVRRTWNFDDVRKQDFLQTGIIFNLTGQTYAEFWHNRRRERFSGIEFAGIRDWNVFARSNFSDPVRIGFFLSRGRRIARFTDPPMVGDGTDAEIFATFKPLTRLVIQPSLNFSELHERDGGPEIFSGYILRTRTTFQFTRELFLRLVLEYNDFSESLDIQPLLTYKLNPFTLFFIGSTASYRKFDDPNEFAQTERQFFAKFQYLFRS